MRTRFDKITGIASGLLSYCHHYGASEFHLDIMEESDYMTLVISASPETISEKELEHLRNCLGAVRQRDIEQDYWELIGESESSTELTLIGMLCDDATVEYDGSLLSITLIRHD